MPAHLNGNDDMSRKSYQIAILGDIINPAVTIERDDVQGAPIRVIPQGGRSGTREILPSDPN